MSLTLQYRVGVKEQIVQALRSVYSSPNFPEPDLKKKINIELQFPIVQEKYPAIYVNWIENSVYDAGLGNYQMENDELVRHWIFEGEINLNIMATDPYERDILDASLADLLAFRHENTLYRQFMTEIYDGDFVMLQPNLAFLIPGGDQVTPAPWQNTDEFIFISSYSIATVGEFISTPDSSTLLRISDVRTYPYRPDQALPSGSLDSLDRQIPWLS